MKAKITSKGQITIPHALRTRLKLGAGQVLEFDETAPYLKAVKVVDEKAMRSVIGIAKTQLAGKTSQEWMDELRGPVEALEKPKTK